MSGAPLVVTVYHREGCHLCDRLLDELRPLRGRLGFTLRVVDIDDDPTLVQRFGLKIPVVAVEDEVVCCHHLDAEALEDVLNP
ncbi:Glutaredoxin-like domain [Ectothiorhodospira mobilis]|uniref:Glutaredoxin-like domain n=1 Tax=Ectothiorhodospira mobilis TaxID=195064 RepID=A0A1I4RSL1_ECTMO|nr:glutaredoxin family protein [Ectothiorhodospira mobilis]SFM55159.1 Glutaredoxin-like domain [Ectothiorhodospira mobilis]